MGRKGKSGCERQPAKPNARALPAPLPAVAHLRRTAVALSLRVRCGDRRGNRERWLQEEMVFEFLNTMVNVSKARGASVFSSRRARRARPSLARGRVDALVVAAAPATRVSEHERQGEPKSRRPDTEAHPHIPTPSSTPPTTRRTSRARSSPSRSTRSSSCSCRCVRGRVPPAAAPTLPPHSPPSVPSVPSSTRAARGLRSRLHRAVLPADVLVLACGHCRRRPRDRPLLGLPVPAEPCGLARECGREARRGRDIRCCCCCRKGRRRGTMTDCSSVPLGVV
jgi:hypothetical protein